jgi:hypothetical protein
MKLSSSKAYRNIRRLTFRISREFRADKTQSTNQFPPYMNNFDYIDLSDNNTEELTEFKNKITLSERARLELEQQKILEELEKTLQIRNLSAEELEQLERIKKAKKIEEQRRRSPEEKALRQKKLRQTAEERQAKEKEPEQQKSNEGKVLNKQGVVKISNHTILKQSSEALSPAEKTEAPGTITKNDSTSSLLNDLDDLLAVVNALLKAPDEPEAVKKEAPITNYPGSSSSNIFDELECFQEQMVKHLWEMEQITANTNTKPADIPAKRPTVDIPAKRPASSLDTFNNAPRQQHQPQYVKLENNKPKRLAHSLPLGEKPAWSSDIPKKPRAVSFTDALLREGHNKVPISARNVA